MRGDLGWRGLVGGTEAISPGVSRKPASHLRVSGGGGLFKSSSPCPHHTCIIRGVGAAKEGLLLTGTTLPPSFSLEVWDLGQDSECQGGTASWGHCEKDCPQGPAMTGCTGISQPRAEEEPPAKDRHHRQELQGARKPPKDAQTWPCDRNQLCMQARPRWREPACHSERLNNSRWKHPRSDLQNL